jgi:hypothetical protein
MRHLFNCGATAHLGLLLVGNRCVRRNMDRQIIDDSRRVARTAPAAQD